MKFDRLEAELNAWFIRLPILFFGAIVLLHLVLRMLRGQVWFIMHPFWPMSVFYLKQPIWIDVVTIGVAGIIFMLILLVWQSKQQYFLGKLLGLLALMLVTTNLLQGFDSGLIRPVAGERLFSQDYWEDSGYVDGPLVFVRNFSLYQPTLSYHGRVHPPGAVLWFWSWRHILDSPLFVGTVMMITTLVSVGLIYTWVGEVAGEQIARFIAIAFGLMPAFQIYGYASLDGVIMSIFLGSLYCYFKARDGWYYWILAVALLSLSFSLTFGAVWLLPVLAGMSWHSKKLRWQFIYTVLFLVGVGWLVKILLGFNYWDSFWLGKAYEGFRGGWYALVQPISYAVTRVQDLLEPLVFYGPYFSVLTFLSLKVFGTTHELSRLSIFALGSFGIFLLAGAYYTGETARAALYLLPMLTLGMVPLLAKANFSQEMQQKLLIATLAQTLLMQLLGNFVW